MESLILATKSIVDYGANIQFIDHQKKEQCKSDQYMLNHAKLVFMKKFYRAIKS